VVNKPYHYCGLFRKFFVNFIRYLANWRRRFADNSDLAQSKAVLRNLAPKFDQAGADRKNNRIVQVPGPRSCQTA